MKINLDQIFKTDLVSPSTTELSGIGPIPPELSNLADEMDQGILHTGEIIKERKFYPRTVLSYLYEKPSKDPAEWFFPIYNGVVTIETKSNGRKVKARSCYFCHKQLTQPNVARSHVASKHHEQAVELFWQLQKSTSLVKNAFEKLIQK